MTVFRPFGTRIGENGHKNTSQENERSLSLTLLLQNRFMKRGTRARARFRHFKFEAEGISEESSMFLSMYDITKKLDRFCGKWFLRASMGKEMFTQE